MSAALKTTETTAKTFDTIKGAEDPQTSPQESTQKATKFAQEWSSFGQDNIEALLKSGQIWTAGVQALAKQVASSAQTSLEVTLETFNSLSSAKSAQEALGIQTRLAHSALERALAESRVIGETSVKSDFDSSPPKTGLKAAGCRRKTANRRFL